MRTVITPYRGFGKSNELLIRGRVLREQRISAAPAGETMWRSLLNTWRRFESDEVPGAKVRARYRDAVVETVANSEGHFQVRLQPKVIDADRLWHEVNLDLVEPWRGAAVGHVIVPPGDAEFGVISDIDDTILQTGATSLRAMIRSVVRNAAARLPFEGVADLYAALHRNRNPLFYVSSSPWNLYELLADFKQLNGIPPGPMFLQDWGLDRGKFIHDAHDVHKLREIQTILDYYPQMSFVLIGDSGQKDPEIYLRVVQANTTRIKAVFIRDVTADVRDKGVTRIADDIGAAGVPFFYVQSSAEALRQAAILGLCD